MNKKLFAVIAGLAAVSLILKVSAIICAQKECGTDDSGDFVAEE